MSNSAECSDRRIAMIDVRRDEDWPKSVSTGIRRYLTALADDGPERLMTNAKGVRAEILRVGEGVMPILISDGAPGKASILSPLGHHVRYPVEEISRQSRWLGKPLLAALAAPLTMLLKAAKIDRAVFVNHWLLSGAPAPDVPAGAWGAVLNFLADRFPGHAVVVPDIKPALHAGLVAETMVAGAIAVPTRCVHIVDPGKPLAGTQFRQVRYKRTRGEKMLCEAEADELTQEEIRHQPQRLAMLYRRSNISRHSALNPDYTSDFFCLSLSCEQFRVRAWKAADATDRRIVVYSMQRVDSEMIHWSTFGAQEEAERRTSYYQRATAADLLLATETGLRLDWGAGADRYKRLRGAEAFLQVELAFCEHLGTFRRSAWRMLARLRKTRWKQVHGGDLAEIEPRSS